MQYNLTKQTDINEDQTISFYFRVGESALRVKEQVKVAQSKKMHCHKLEICGILTII